jgi:threonine dehydrogenase-like Zn-dependent dehydrogenase
MKQIAIREPGKVSIIEVREPKMSSPSQIKSRTIHTGISIGSELTEYRGSVADIRETWKNTKSKTSKIDWLEEWKFPFFPGYENVGKVVEVGECVDNVKAGDRVIHCGPHAEVCVVPQTQAHLPVYAVIPNSVSDEDATFAVLGTTALWGVMVGRVRYGENVVTLGDGVVGILSALHAKLAGANKSILVGLSDRKLQVAKEAGVDVTINHRDENWTDRIADVTDGLGPDVVLEAVGSSTSTSGTVREACEIAKEKGRVVLVGWHMARQTDWIPGADFYFKELTMYTSRAMGPGSHHPFLLDSLNKIQEYNYLRWTTSDLFRYVIQLIEERKLNVHPLVTHRYKYTEASEVYRRIDEAKEDFLQVLLTGW